MCHAAQPVARTSSRWPVGRVDPRIFPVVFSVGPGGMRLAKCAGMTRLMPFAVGITVAACMVACGGAIDSGDGDSASQLGAAGRAGAAQGGAAGQGSAGEGPADACSSPLDCPVPAVACEGGVGAPYAPTCVDGVCGLVTEPCPPAQPGPTCGIFGCCQTVAECTSAPAVGPCPDGSAAGSMACDDGVCTYHPVTCPSTGTGGDAGAPMCSTDPPPGSMGFSLSDGCRACAANMHGSATADPTLDCGAVDAACQGDCACRHAVSCLGAQMVVNGKSADCAVAACAEDLAKAPASAALLTCLAEQCATDCGLSGGEPASACP